MNFTQRMLNRNHRSGQVRLDPIDEYPAHHKEIQHNIVTTISSTNSLYSGHENKKVTIETTVSWSKLPQLKPLHPVMEVISDGTSSTDSDEKENERPESLKSFSHHNEETKFKKLGAMYSDDPDVGMVQQAEDCFASKQSGCDETARNKPAGRSARLAALANTINQWEDDLRPVGKLDKKEPNQSSVLTKHSVMKDKGKSEHRKFISPQKGGYIFNQNNAKTLKRPQPTMPPENEPKVKKPSPTDVTKENTKPVVWDPSVIECLEKQGFSRSVSQQRLIYNYNEEEKATSPAESHSPEKLLPPERAKSAFSVAQSPPKNLPIRSPSPVKGRYGSPIQMGVSVMKGANNRIPSSSDEESSAPVMGIKQLRNWSCSGNRSRDASPTKQTKSPVVNRNRDISPTKETRDTGERDTRPVKEIRDTGTKWIRDTSPVKETRDTGGKWNRDTSPVKETRDTGGKWNRDTSPVKEIRDTGAKWIRDTSPVKETRDTGGKWNRDISPVKETRDTGAKWIRDTSPVKETRDTGGKWNRDTSPVKETRDTGAKWIRDTSPVKEIKDTGAKWVRDASPVKEIRDSRANWKKDTNSSKEIISTKDKWEKNTSPKNNTKTAAIWSRNQNSMIIKCEESNRNACSVKKGKDAGVNQSRDHTMKQIKESGVDCNRDPAELSVAERKALFERNAGPAPLPRAPFTQAVVKPSKPQQLSGSLHDRLVKFEKGSQDKSDQKEMSERQKELELLRQRWNRNKDAAMSVKEEIKPRAPPTPPPLPSPPEPFEFGRNRSFYGEDDQELTDAEDAYPTLKDVKRVRFSPPKPGYLYPCLTDQDTEMEGTEVEYSDTNRSSLSSSSKNSDRSSCEPDYLNHSKASLKRDWSASESSGVNEMDEFLEEALNISSDETSPPKRSSYSNKEGLGQHRARDCSPNRRKQRQSSGSPLLHTVSFYRKQQNMAVKPTTPIRCQVVDPGCLDESFDQPDDDFEEELVKQKIERLQLEVTKQEQYISQASQALDLCYSTFEFSGSTELLEAEKLLLLASQRRRALQQELHRLRTEGRLYPEGPSTAERGSLTVSRVTLPLKMDAVHQAAKDDECYYLLCVVRHHEDLQCSEIVSTRRSLHNGNMITFPDTFTVRDLYNDFNIAVEIYMMKARHKELIPHDIKYHINTNKKEVNKLRLTPRKTKAESRRATPSTSTCAPARTPAFTLAGHLVFSLRDVHRNQFTLCKNNQVYNNAVEGSLQMRLQSEMRVDVEYRGFLTMFEDVSGLGAWHRRWCLLRGDKLSYWRYPDDERKKIPLDTIELSQCAHREVEVVSRDVCARPNTLQLYTVRPTRFTDTESLVVTRRGDKTCVRHWLSADTREERDQWCHHLNKALTMMRAWGMSTAL